MTEEAPFCDFYAHGLEMPGRVYVSGSKTKEGYTGHELDAETGLNYAGARYYDPAIARFISTDPHAAFYPAWSPYNYVMGNPLLFIDPNGKDPCEIDGETYQNCAAEADDVVVEADRSSLPSAGFWLVNSRGDVVENREEAARLYVDPSSQQGLNEFRDYMRYTPDRACSVATGSSMSMASRSAAMNACVTDRETFAGIMTLIAAPLAVGSIGSGYLGGAAWSLSMTRDAAMGNRAGLVVNTVALVIPLGYANRGVMMGSAVRSVNGPSYSLPMAVDDALNFNGYTSGGALLPLAFPISGQ
jgi:RHS repeat-associated protein